MTGRQDVVTVPTFKPGNLYKNMQNLQIKDDTQDLSKQTKRLGQISKSSKPTMEIYRPPKVGQKNGTKVHFQMSPTRNKGSPPPSNNIPPAIELKSALKRSKSFTSSENSEIAEIDFNRDAFPVEYQGLIRRAVIDPNVLSCQKLMELVRLICSKAVEKVQYSLPAAKLCFAIIEKEHDHTFLESLQNCCHEWYNERDKLLRSPFLASGTAFSGLRRWTAYIAFLTELYQLVKHQHCQGIQINLSTLDPNFMGPHPNSPMAHFAMTLMTLLYECLYIILKPPSLNNAGEIECLRSTLMTIGKQLETDSSQRMQHLIGLLRDAFVNPSINAQIRKTLLEVIELHACSWKLELSQRMYYFPYTNFERV